MTYKEALKSGKRKAKSCSSVATDEEILAVYLHDMIQIQCGAVSPELVFEGARKKGMTFKQVVELAHKNPAAIEALMWE